MAKSELDKIMEQLRAKSKAAKPIPIALALRQTNAKPLPWADVLPPETEWEKAMREAEDRPVLRLGNRGPDLNKPYFFRGKVGQPQKLSELSTEELDLAGQAEGNARMEDAQPYKGTPQERIAISHIKAKIVRKKPLTNAEKKLWGKFTMAKLVARAGLNRRQA